MGLFRQIGLQNTPVLVKGSGGLLFWGHAANTHATLWRYLKFYDSLGAPTVGATTPVFTLGLPPNTALDLRRPRRLRDWTFQNGIWAAATTGAADADTGNPGATDVIVNATFTPDDVRSGGSAPTMQMMYLAAAGSNSNSGLDAAHAWADLTNLQGVTLGPGSVVNLKAGDTFTLAGTIGINASRYGGITLSAQGAAGAPVTFAAYGQAKTTTTGPLAAGTLPVASTAGFAATGTLVAQIQYTVGGTTFTSQTSLAYTGKTANSFTGCTGGNGVIPTGASVVNMPIISISGDWDGFNIGDGTGYLTLSNLIIQGDGVQRSYSGVIQQYTHGIYLRNINNAQATNVSLQNCVIKGFANGGGIQHDEAPPGLVNSSVILSSVTVTGCEITGSINSVALEPVSIGARSSTGDIVKNISGLTFTSNNVHHNPGRSDQGTTAENGWGFVAIGGYNWLIQGNLFDRNGASSGSGAQAVTLFAADSILIQRNLVQYQLNNNGLDGNGIEINAGCTRTVTQFNYVHDCQGIGVVVGQAEGLIETKDNVVRYNIVANNVTNVAGTGGGFPDGGYAGVTIWGKVTNLHVYNNTIYQLTSVVTNSRNAGLFLVPDYPGLTPGATVMTNVSIRNNAFSVTAASGNALIYGSSDLNGSSQFVSLTFINNCWFTTAAGVRWYITVAGITTQYTSLANWGQDALGIATDPKLADPGNTGADSNYRLTTGSPALTTGVNVFGAPYNEAWDPYGFGALGLPIGSAQDYFGQAIPVSGNYNIGAYGGLGVVSALLLEDGLSHLLLEDGASKLLLES